MKQVWKWGSIASAASLLWLALLLAPGLPSSLTLLLPYLPVYSIVALGCYGLAMLGYGMMVFPTCPEEALLLQKDIAAAKEFYREHGLDLSAPSN
ncbi:unnamed protein product [Sphagnum troendelagicum]|jgi:dolichyl-phosphate mannosyltransferase polypeptide 3|uniref:Dolichol-phosphate mannosyltransferase subunit 3 n=2 Tax=Sphagnum TaxID=13804 RepID=A0ABP0TWR2_9BRYO|nr:hypothetical protein BDL97_15G093900 [Sphagnum fallax]